MSANHVLQKTDVMLTRFAALSEGLHFILARDMNIWATSQEYVLARNGEAQEFHHHTGGAKTGTGRKFPPDELVRVIAT